jgi:hypothetical protein
MENGQEPATKHDIRLVQKEVVELRTELKQDIVELRTELKQDIVELRTELKQEMLGLRQDMEQMRTESQHAYDDLKETMRDGQTELLRAFYSFAQTTDAKLKDTETSDIALRQRLTAVEVRLTEIEKRINLPPAA